MNDNKTPHLAPEDLRYTKYYEYDGLLRAYSNRAWALALLLGILSLGLFAFAVYVRREPPTVIRVDKNGDASVVGGPQQTPARFPRAFSSQAAAAAAPTDLEGRAAVRQFLDDYLVYTPDSVDHNFSEALNMMTVNLRTLTIDKLRDENIVGKIKDDHIISDFELRSIEHVKNTPWTYVMFGLNEIHRVKHGRETIDRIVGQYMVRLVESQRSDLNPSGLLVAEFNAQAMVGDRNDGLNQKSVLEMGSGSH
ncbi:MAG: VirB8/TrbF family protein [Candidatus Acidiferrales bacterium]